MIHNNYLTNRGKRKAIPFVSLNYSASTVDDSQMEDIIEKKTEKENINERGSVVWWCGGVVMRTSPIAAR